jgi:hypothetical protein
MVYERNGTDLSAVDTISLSQSQLDETSVASLCARLGFSHPGQMAAGYRAMFGELPSVTLRRSG